MKNLIAVALTAVLALAGASAQAADIYNGGKMTPDREYVERQSPSLFAGAYVGASVNWDMLDVQHGGSITEYCCDPENGNELISGPLDDMSGEGLSGGVRLGYNWQVGRIYFGPVAMFDLGGPSAGLSYGDEFVGASGELSVNWKATIAGKLGFAVTDRLGAYGLVGWTMADADVDAEGHAFGLSIQKHHNKVVQGFTYGGGVDVKLSDSVTAFAEYQHVNLSDFDASGSLLIDCIEYDYKAEPELDTIKVGLTYTFN